MFTFRWRDDPRKDEAWYEKQKNDYDPVTVAAEIDINYSASAEGALSPSAWVQAAVDAHRILGVAPTGARRAALDVADEGRDLNAFIGVHGCVVETIEEWSGVGDDIFSTTKRAFDLCDAGGLQRFPIRCRWSWSWGPRRCTYPQRPASESATPGRRSLPRLRRGVRPGRRSGAGARAWRRPRI